MLRLGVSRLMNVVNVIAFPIFVKLRYSEIKQFIFSSPLLIQCVQIFVLRAKKVEIIFEVRFPRNGSFEGEYYAVFILFNLQVFELFELH